jgi:hypothetical protein
MRQQQNGLDTACLKIATPRRWFETLANQLGRDAGYCIQSIIGLNEVVSLGFSSEVGKHGWGKNGAKRTPFNAIQCQICVCASCSDMR